MTEFPNALWLDANPSFTRFHVPLVQYLAKSMRIATWSYYQEQDEASSLEIALTLLHDYLKNSDRPIHLIGHATGGLIGLLYARKYPERVKSLTLLGVGVNPAVDWQSHYYALQELLPCSRETLLAQMTWNIFGHQDSQTTTRLGALLELDLASSPSPHSLYKRVGIPQGGIESPLLICGSTDDTIVDRNALQKWQALMKPSDRLWECDGGRHFFHYFHSALVGRRISNFWQSQVSNSLQLTAQPVQLQWEGVVNTQSA
ncbi:MAG: alpha/beta hydrolase [Cyanobacteria bacterium P01_E01_bin.42]